ncbi:MAG: class I SAM-dependent methyltransferase [Candidatus Dormibacteria bacterium]
MQVGGPSAEARLAGVISDLVGHDSWRLELWDGRAVGPRGGEFTLRLCDRRALDRLLGTLPERGFGRAYVAGLLEIEPLDAFLRALTRVPPKAFIMAAPRLLRAAVALGARPDWRPVAAAEARLRGRRHSVSRDAEAVRHHYDLPPEFYALWLDPTLTYSCAYYATPGDDLATAQSNKLDLVCRKLRLQPGERLLDIGCGWGSLPIHAAREFGVEAVGITLSPAQAEFAQRRVAEEGLGDRVEIRLADYREPQGTYDAVASIGMIEHVGRAQLPRFARAVFEALRPRGRALIHGITIPPTIGWSRFSFTNAFVFPDGELEDIGFVDTTLERAGLELRDVESLRGHYARTLEAWAARLEQRYAEAEAIAGPERARVWKLYMTGAAVGFRLGTLSIHQSLLVRPDPDGEINLPATRADWYAGAAEDSAPGGAELVGRAELARPAAAGQLGSH